MKMERILLSDMIGELRAELQKAFEQGKDEYLRFTVESAELEIQAGVTDEGEALGGIKFWVLNADAKMKTNSQAVQKITLKLKPVGPDGKTPVLVKDERNLSGLPDKAKSGE